GQQDICIVRCVGLKMFQNDGEQVFTLESCKNVLLIWRNRGRIAVVDNQRSNRRFSLRQSFAESAHVDCSRRSFDQVGTLQRRSVVLEESARTQQCAAAGMAPGSDNPRETENVSYSHGAASVALKAVVEPNELRRPCCVFPR